MDAFWKFNVQENPINYLRCKKVLPDSQKHDRNTVHLVQSKGPQVHLQPP